MARGLVRALLLQAELRVLDGGAEGRKLVCADLASSGGALGGCTAVGCGCSGRCLTGALLPGARTESGEVGGLVQLRVLVVLLLGEERATVTSAVLQARGRLE